MSTNGRGDQGKFISIHPSHDVLRSFVVGKLNDAESARVETHLAKCKTCTNSLTEGPCDDAFVELVRSVEAHPENHSTVDGQLTLVGEGLTDRTTIAGYEIGEELGRGGLGVVYRARHLKLNRPVALKVILSGQHATSEQRRRFRMEAETIARLRHPGIVQIHEVGEHEGRPYLALELMEGGGLQSHTNRNPQDANWSARLIERLARAVHYAHQQGVVHRDLKPANVLLDDTHASPIADPLPKITDFGLAKDLAAMGEMTQTGMLMGTPSYLPPEQTTGNSRDTTAQSDIYSLGAILYELLTGHPPFMADDLLETIRMVREDEPVPPRRLQPSVPRDLQTICLKCLEKESHRRYTTAEDLAADLQRYLHMEPIHARPVGIIRRATLTYCRNKTLAHVIAITVLTLVAGLSAYFAALEIKNKQLAQLNAELTRSNSDLETQTNAALAARNQSQASALEAQTQEALAKEQSQIALAERDHAHQLLRIARARGMAAQSLAERDRNPTLSLLLARESVMICQRAGAPILPVAHEQLIAAVAHAGGQPFPRTGHYKSTQINTPLDLMLTIEFTGEAKLWDLRAVDPAATARSFGKEHFFARAAFSPDGSRLVGTHRLPSSTAIWKIPVEGRERTFDTANPISLEKTQFVEPKNCVARKFSPDRRWCVTFHKSKLARLWHLESEDDIGPIMETDCCTPNATTLSHCGRYFVCANSDGTQLRAWDLTAESPRETLSEVWTGRQRVSTVKFSPDSSRLAATLVGDRRLLLWNVTPDGFESRSTIPAWRYETGKYRFGNTGRWLLTTSAESAGKLWRLDESSAQHEPIVLTGWRSNNYRIVFSPDDAWLATCDFHAREIYVWDVENAAAGQPPAILRGHTVDVRDIWFASDGRLFSVDRKRQMRVWTKDDYARLAFPSVRHAPRTVGSVAHAPDGALVVAPSGRKVMLWDALPSKPTQPRITFPEAATHVAVSADGKWIAQATAKGVLLRRFDACTSAAQLPRPVRLEPDAGLWKVTFSADSRMLAAAAYDGLDVLVWELSDEGSPAEVLRWKSRRGICDVALSPDGKFLAAAEYKGFVHLIRLDTDNAANTAPVIVSGRSHQAHAVAFSPQGGQLASSTASGDLVLWNLDDNGKVMSTNTLRGHVDRALDIEYRDDGKQLASAGFDRTVRLWDLTADDPARAATVIRAFDTPVWTVDYSPNGFITTGTQDGEFATWDLRTDALMAEAARIAGRELTDAERKRYFDLSVGME